MDFYSRQLKALQAVPSKHRPTHRRASEVRKHLREGGLDDVVPQDRLEKRKLLAKAVGDPFLNERVIGTMDLLPVNFLERGAAAAKSVCRIELKDDLGRWDGCATGVSVGQHLLLTNHHVFPTKDHARRSMAQFNYADDAHGEPMPSHTFKFDPDRFFCTDEHLDYTLVAVRPTSLDGTPLASFGVSTLVRDPGKTILSEHLNIVQHPSGQNKQVAIRHNELSEETDDFLLYVADTDKGSSGSAVYNDAWVVVALHCAGVAKLDDKGRYIDKHSGKPIQGKPKSINDVECVANRGVRISRIYDHLKSRQDLTDDERQLALSVFKTIEEFTADMLASATVKPPVTPAVVDRPAAIPPSNASSMVERFGPENNDIPTAYDPNVLRVPVPFPKVAVKVTVAQIEQLTGLDFGPLRDADTAIVQGTHEKSSAHLVREVIDITPDLKT